MNWQTAAVIVSEALAAIAQELLALDARYEREEVTRQAVQDAFAEAMGSLRRLTSPAERGRGGARTLAANALAILDGPDVDRKILAAADALNAHNRAAALLRAYQTGDTSAIMAHPRRPNQPPSGRRRNPPQIRGEGWTHQRTDPGWPQTWAREAEGGWLEVEDDGETLRLYFWPRGGGVDERVLVTSGAIEQGPVTPQREALFEHGDAIATKPLGFASSLWRRRRSNTADRWIQDALSDSDTGSLADWLRRVHAAPPFGLRAFRAPAGTIPIALLEDLAAQLKQRQRKRGRFTDAERRRYRQILLALRLKRIGARRQTNPRDDDAAAMLEAVGERLDGVTIHRLLHELDRALTEEPWAGAAIRGNEAFVAAGATRSIVTSELARVAPGAPSYALRRPSLGTLVLANPAPPEREGWRRYAEAGGVLPFEPERKRLIRARISEGWSTFDPEIFRGPSGESMKLTPEEWRFADELSTAADADEENNLIL